MKRSFRSARRRGAGGDDDSDGEEERGVNARVGTAAPRRGPWAAPAHGTSHDDSDEETLGEGDDAAGGVTAASMKLRPAPTHLPHGTAADRGGDGPARHARLVTPGASLVGGSYSASDLAALRSKQLYTMGSREATGGGGPRPGPAGITLAGEEAVAMTAKLTSGGMEGGGMPQRERGTGNEEGVLEDDDTSGAAAAMARHAAAAQVARSIARQEMSFSSVLRHDRGAVDSYTPVQYAQPGLAASMASLHMALAVGVPGASSARGGAPAPPAPSAPSPLTMAAMLSSLSHAATAHRTSAAGALSTAHTAMHDHTQASMEVSEAESKLRDAVAKFDTLAAVRQLVSRFVSCARAKAGLVADLFTASVAVVRAFSYAMADARAQMLCDAVASCLASGGGGWVCINDAALVPQPQRPFHAHATAPSSATPLPRLLTSPLPPGGVTTEEWIAALYACTLPDRHVVAATTAAACQAAVNDLLAALSKPSSSDGSAWLDWSVVEAAAREGGLASCVGQARSHATAALLAAHTLIYADVKDRYAAVDALLSALVPWRGDGRWGHLYAHSFAHLSLPQVLTPTIRHQSWPWLMRPWVQAASSPSSLDALPWFRPLWEFSDVAAQRAALPTTSTALAAALDADERLLPTLVADAVAPGLVDLIQAGYDVLDREQTRLLHAAVVEVALFDPPAETLMALHAALAARLTAACHAAYVPVLTHAAGGGDGVVVHVITLQAAAGVLVLARHVGTWCDVLPPTVMAQLVVDALIGTALSPLLQWLGDVALGTAPHVHTTPTAPALLHWALGLVALVMEVVSPVMACTRTGQAAATPAAPLPPPSAQATAASRSMRRILTACVDEGGGRAAMAARLDGMMASWGWPGH